MSFSTFIDVIRFLTCCFRFHEKVDFILHRPVVEYCIIFLIIVDALLVTASLMLEIKLLEGESATSPCPVYSGNYGNS